MTDSSQVNSMSNLSSSQLNYASQIIEAGNLAGEPIIVIQAAVLIAFTESSLGNNMQSPGQSATGLFQYLPKTWSAAWNQFLNANPNGPLSSLSVGEAISYPEAQIQVMYRELNGLYAGYDDGDLAKNYLPDGNLYNSVTVPLQDAGIDISSNFFDYAYLRHNTALDQKKTGRIYFFGLLLRNKSVPFLSSRLYREFCFLKNSIKSGEVM